VLLEFLARVRAHQRALRKYGLVVALIAFAGGLILALNSVDLVRIRWLYLVGYALVLPPLGFFLQCSELRLTAKAGGASLSWHEAIEVVIYAKAATLLPVPGGFVTRVAALKAKGVPVARSSLIVLLFTGVLGTVAFTYAGAWLYPAPLSYGFFAVAICGLITCTGIGRRVQIPGSIIVQEVALRLLAVAVETIGLVFAFAVIGVSVGVEQTGVMVVASFIGLVVSIVPAGIGIREGVIAALSPFVGIDPAVGFLAAAVGRLVGFSWLCLIALSVLARRKDALS
jgi:hypothetical protein